MRGCSGSLSLSSALCTPKPTVIDEAALRNLFIKKLTRACGDDYLGQRFLADLGDNPA
jgi:hypothetical protein